MKKVAIIGGGISGLSALHFVRTRFTDDVEVTLFEKEKRLGGTVGTDRSDGYISDWGPNGFLDKVPLTLSVVKELGLEHLLEPAQPKAEKRFIYRHGRLNEIVPSPIKFLTSPVLSISGRMRLVTEPFRAAKRDGKDETVFDFAARRIGREAAETLVEPMVSGIFGGDARKLSLKACFPVMVEMELQYGSLVKALIARKKAGSKGGPAGPSGRLTSFKGGVFTIIEHMHEKYKQYISTDAEVVSINKTGNGYKINIKDEPEKIFDSVICASPTYAASDMVNGMDKNLTTLLGSIPYASIAVVCLGFNKTDVAHDLDGFGFLVPRREGMRILGSIWTSSIFPGRAPEDTVQVRTMIGGATDPEAVNLDDEALKKIVLTELDDILVLKNPPVYVKIYRYARGIPQFLKGHRDKMAELDEILKGYPGLYFTGNAYDGVGLNDCVVRSDKVVKQLAEFLEIPVTSVKA